MTFIYGILHPCTDDTHEWNLSSDIFHRIVCVRIHWDKTMFAQFRTNRLSKGGKGLICQAKCRSVLIVPMYWSMQRQIDPIFDRNSFMQWINFGSTFCTEVNQMWTTFCILLLGVENGEISSMLWMKFSISNEKLWMPIAKSVLTFVEARTIALGWQAPSVPIALQELISKSLCELPNAEINIQYAASWG